MTLGEYGVLWVLDNNIELGLTSLNIVLSGPS